MSAEQIALPPAVTQAQTIAEYSADVDIYESAVGLGMSLMHQGNLARVALGVLASALDRRYGAGAVQLWASEVQLGRSTAYEYAQVVNALGVHATVRHLEEGRSWKFIVALARLPEAAREEALANDRLPDSGAPRKPAPILDLDGVRVLVDGGALIIPLGDIDAPQIDPAQPYRITIHAL